MNRVKTSLLLIAALAITAVFISGCGGGSSFDGIDGTGFSDVSGTLSDINRATITGGTVWVEGQSNITAKSLASGAYKLIHVRSGWQNVRARATINGVQWVGCTAAQILSDEPTMNINITLAPATQTTSISGVVKDENGRRIFGARVLLTTRTVYPPEQTSAYDGPYGSIVAITDNNGRYKLENVPIGITAVISASKARYRNREYQIDSVQQGTAVDFVLLSAGNTLLPYTPKLEYIESYTMPNTITVMKEGDSTTEAYKAIKSYISPRFKKAVAGKSVTSKPLMTPAGSLIEIDLYWNAFTDNDSRDVAGYGIYRTINASIEPRAIDFIRDPYANFYGDMGAEITPYQYYYYAITAVDVAYLDSHGDFIDGAESNKSNILGVKPIGQLVITSPTNGQYVSANPTFNWASLGGASKYRILIFDRFPAYNASPIVDETVTASGLYTYNGYALRSGNSYYWVMLASDSSGTSFSYSDIRKFYVR